MAFDFKQFSVSDDGCTLKVGTDGVLIGAWADVQNCNTILEIGTGSGVIALMLAQRNLNALVDAVEIDSHSAETAKRNFLKSPWSGRLNVHHCSIQEYAKTNKKYDLIVCSPPYFRNSMKPLRREDFFSKHDDNLPYEALIAVSFSLLDEFGKFCVILPSNEEKYFCRLASAQGYFVAKKLHMFPVIGKPAKRIVLQLEKQRREVISEEITILEEPSGEYTDEYMSFSKEFYLAF